MIPWTYEDKVVTEAPKDAKAFVYYLEFADGSKYIGKKNLHSTRRKKVTGKTRRVITITESNWKKYFSSSDEVKARIKAGEQLVRREVIRWCDTTGEASYWEAYEMFTRHVLLSITYLNKWISIKTYKRLGKDESSTEISR